MIYHLLAFLTVAIWGTTFVSTKLLLTQGLSPATIFFIRFMMAYGGMVLTQAFTDYRNRKHNATTRKKVWRCQSVKDEGLMALAGMAGGSLYFLTENTALQLALAANVSLIVCLAPMLTAIFALFVNFEKRASAKLWAGSLIAFSGVAFVVYGSTHAGTASNPLLGNLLALAAAALWAVYQLIIKPLGKRYGTLMLTRKVFGYGLLTIVPFMLNESSTNWHALTRPEVTSNLLFLGLVASLLCYAVWNLVTEKIGSLVSANYIYLNPLVTCVASYFILGEQLTTAMMAGGIAIVIGLYIAIAPKPSRSRKPNGNHERRT